MRNDGEPLQRRASSEASAAEASVLLCPHCRYNLTGLPIDRCPECGAAFDRAALERAAAGEFGPLIPQFRGRATFLRIFRSALFSPARLAREFPANHDARYSRDHALVCALLVGAIFLIAAVISPIPSIAQSTILFITCVAGVIGARLCDLLVAGLWTRLAEPVGAAGRFAFWAGLTRCTNGYLLLSAAWGSGFLSLFEYAQRTVGDAFQLLMPFGAAAIFLWWATALALVVRARARPGLGRFLAMLVPIFAGALAIAIGAGIGVLMLLAPI